MSKSHTTHLSFWIVLFLTISLSVLTTPTPVDAATDTAAFVTRTGTKFYLNGREFKFVGFNLFDAAATSFYKCAWWSRFTDSELDATLKYMRQTSGATVLRFWAFQRYTRSGAGTDWSGIDKVLRIAKANGFKVLPVLENGPGACTSKTSIEKWQYEGDTWYTTGYKMPFGSDPLSYRNYVKAIVTRYKDDPTILGWVMMNDANTGKRDAAGKTVLINFAKDIGGLIKSIDSKHLVTLGTQSNGATGTTGKDFVDVYSLPELDFTTGTDRGYWVSQENDPLPGSADGKTLPNVNSADCLKTYQAKVACALANAMQVVKKPFVMMDAGIKVENNPTSRQTRATVMGNKMSAMFTNGASGYVLWHWNKMIDEQKYDIIQSQNDPLLARMKTFAGTLTTIDSPSAPGTPPAPLTSGTNTIVERGVNLMGGWQSLYGSADNFATTQQLDYYKSKGLNTFRVGFLWERLQPTLKGPLDAAYLAKMDKLVADVRARGQKLTFVPLPGKWKGNDVGTDAVPQDAFNDLWIRLATKYKNEPAIWGYSLINEPGMGDVWNIKIAPGAIAAIRTIDMVKPIIVPTSTGGYVHNHKYHLIGLPMQDPANNLIYEAHVYFDTPADGVYAKGFDVPNANLNIGVDRARDFVQWCQSNNQKCYFGEYGVPAGWKMGTPACSYLGGTNNDPRWLTVLDNFMNYLDQNNISGTYWAGGPYGDINSAGPFCDTPGQLNDGAQMPILTKHLARTASGTPLAMASTTTEMMGAKVAQPTLEETSTLVPTETLVETCTPVLTDTNLVSKTLVQPTVTATPLLTDALSTEGTPAATETLLTPCAPAATETLVAASTLIPATETLPIETVTLFPTVSATDVPTVTQTEQPTQIPTLVPSATLTETPIVLPTVVIPTATSEVIVVPTQSVIVIGDGQAAPTATQESIIVIGEPVINVPVVPTLIPSANPVIVVPTAAPPVTPTAIVSPSSPVSLVLVNADTQADLLTITNGMIIDMATLGTRNITIRAMTQGAVGSVVFGLDANAQYRVENEAPYALYNDSLAYAWPYTLGQHTVTATAYSLMGGSGTIAGTLSVQFTLIDTAGR